MCACIPCWLRLKDSVADAVKSNGYSCCGGMLKLVHVAVLHTVSAACACCCTAELVHVLLSQRYGTAFPRVVAVLLQVCLLVTYYSTAGQEFVIGSACLWVGCYPGFWLYLLPEVGALSHCRDTWPVLYCTVLSSLGPQSSPARAPPSSVG
jgi:hypothetical protein